MDYNQFVHILEKHLYKNAKMGLLKSLSDNPDRFMGIFRATTPKTKIRQFLTQSCEIRFDDTTDNAATK